MGETKKIVIKVLYLFVDVFLLGVKVIRQIALPGKSNNGNILSSILIFFIALVERLYLFEHGFFRMTNIFRLKYVRRIVIIIAGILFILASFECTVSAEDNVVEAGIELLSSITQVKDIQDYRVKTADHFDNKEKLIVDNPCTKAAFISPLKKYLFTHSLLI